MREDLGGCLGQVLKPITKEEFKSGELSLHHGEKD